MDKEVHEAFYGKYNGVFCTCASSVYQASPWEGGAWGQGYTHIMLKMVYIPDEVSHQWHIDVYSSPLQFLSCGSHSLLWSIHLTSKSLKNGTTLPELSSGKEWIRLNLNISSSELFVLLFLIDYHSSLTNIRLILCGCLKIMKTSTPFYLTLWWRLAP